jgi:hypothetical protein
MHRFLEFRDDKRIVEAAMIPDLGDLLYSMNITVKNTFLDVNLKSDEKAVRRRKSCPPRAASRIDQRACISDKWQDLQSNDVNSDCSITDSTNSGEETPKSSSVAGSESDWRTENEDTNDSDKWSGVTTAMIRNLPCRCTEAEVLEAVSDLGFANNLDFFYMPLRSGAKQNQGYAFIGFRDTDACWRFRKAITGYRLQCRRSSKTMSVLPATIQNAAAYRAHLKAREAKQLPLLRS